MGFGAMRYVSGASPLKIGLSTENDCGGDALNYYLTFFSFGNTTSDPNQHKPCPGTRPLTYAALDLSLIHI